MHMASVSVSALSDVDALSALLPEECELDGEPLLTARITRLYDIGWLAGRSYNIVQVTVPVTFRHEREILHASFMPVLWESLADPILTGRDELGQPKLWARDPRPVDFIPESDGEAHLGDRIMARLQVLRPAKREPGGGAAATGGRFLARSHSEVCATHRSVGRGGCRLPDRRDGRTAHRVLEYRQGTGRFAFRPARWEDMPTQYHVVSMLAGLPLHEFRSASYLVTRRSGDPIGLNQKIVS